MKQGHRSLCILRLLRLSAAVPATFLFVAASGSTLIAEDLSRAVSAPRLKIVAFGNSLTARSRWPAALQAAMVDCLSSGVTVEVVAQVGVTSAWAVDNVDRVIAAKPNVILIQFSENDAAINRYMSVESSRTNIGQVFDRLRTDAPNARVFYMAMNPLHGWRGWTRPFLSSYIEAHRQEAQRWNIPFIDFRPHWNTLTQSALATHIPDGLHPDTSKVSEIMIPVLTDILISDRDCSSQRPD